MKNAENKPDPYAFCSKVSPPVMRAHLLLRRPAAVAFLPMVGSAPNQESPSRARSRMVSHVRCDNVSSAASAPSGRPDARQSSARAAK